VRVAIAIALVLVASIAHAQELGEPALAPAVADGRLASIDDGIDEVFAAWVSERLFAGDLNEGAVPVAPLLDHANDLMLLTEIGARFGMTRDTRVRADWGIAYDHTRVTGQYMDTATSTMRYDATSDRVSTRNPVLSFEWAPLIGNTRFSFGLGAAIPSAAGGQLPSTLATAADRDASYVAYAVMIASAGGFAPWRYRAERLGLFLPLSLSVPIDRLTLTIEGAAAVACPVTGAGRVPATGDLSADLQISGDVIPELRLGARVGVSVLDIGANTASGAPGTIAQPSLSGFARVRLDPVFLYASVLVDVGGYYGFGAGSGGVWSATIGGGAAVP
jgi:hypothetical protein